MTDIKLIQGSGGGGGKGGGGGRARTPVEYPDSLQSTSYAVVLDAIGSGELAGPLHPSQPLRDVFLDGTPIQNADGSLNFQGVEYDYRVGTLDQSYIKGFPNSVNVLSAGIEVKTNQPWIQAFTDTRLSAIRVTLKVPQLVKYIESGGQAGDRVGTRVDYAIDVSTDSGSFQTVLNAAFDGKTIGGYQRTHRINLPNATNGWQVRVRRLTADSTSSALTNAFLVETYAEVVDGKLTHPMLALSGIKVSAEHFQNIPTRAYNWRGKIIRVPSNYDPETRVYTGIWDGTFKNAWSNNPAWIYYDVLLDPLNGLGDRIDASMIDRYALYQIGAFCDQMVPDGLGGMEPRFTCNVYIQSQEDALAVLDDLSSAFRGIAYWSGEEVIAVADMPRDAVYTYTNANIIGGTVEYSSTPLDTIYTVALVSYNDPTDFYRPKVETARDYDGIQEYGIRKVDLTAFGCSSRGQAKRLGQYMLYTSLKEGGMATFKVGLDGIHCQPGDIVKLADTNRAGKPMGGRVAGVNGGQIALDYAPDIAVGDTLSVNLPDGTLAVAKISSVDWDGSGEWTHDWDTLQVFNRENGRIVQVSPAFSTMPTRDAVWAVDRPELVTQYLRVVNVKEDSDLTYSINGVLHDPRKFDAIEHGLRLDPLPVTVVPPRVQGTPLNIGIDEHYFIRQGVTHHYAEITWDAAEYAMYYDVQWRRDNSDWVQMPRTTTTLVEIPDIYAGQYVVRVRAINALGVASVWQYGTPTDLNGIASAPPTVAFLRAVKEIQAITLEWGYEAGPSIVEKVEIRASLNNEFQASTLVTTAAYPDTTYTLYGLGYKQQMWFWIRLVDKNGTFGDWYPNEHGEGFLGETDDDPGNLLDYLEGQIGRSELAQGLVEEIASEVEVDPEKIITDIIGELTGDEDGWFAGDDDSHFVGTTTTTSVIDAVDLKSVARTETLAAQTGSQIAVLQQEQSAQATDISANARAVTSLAAQTGSQIAAIQQTQFVQATDIYANTQSINTMTSTVGDMSSTVQTTANTVASLEGELEANYQTKVQVNANGHLVQTGFAMGAAIGQDGQAKSEFYVMANIFSILGSFNGQPKPLFTVDGDSAFFNNAFIQDATITTAKIADATITAAKIADATITNAKLANATIESAKIKDGAITSAKIGNAQITNAKIVNAAVETLKIAGHAVSTTAYVSGATTFHFSLNVQSEVVIFLAGMEGSALFSWTGSLDVQGVTVGGKTVASTNMVGRSLSAGSYNIKTNNHTLSLVLFILRR